MQPEKISASALSHFSGHGKLLNTSSLSVRSGFAAACVLTAFVVRYSLAPWLKDQLPFAFFVPAALIAAWKGGPVTGFFALLAGLLLGEYFFAPPHAFGPSGPAGLITLLSCAVTVVIGVAIVEFAPGPAAVGVVGTGHHASASGGLRARTGGRKFCGRAKRASASWPTRCRKLSGRRDRTGGWNM